MGLTNKRMGMPTLENGKLTERIALNFTEAEALDLMHAAADEDRTIAEYIRRSMKEKLYGVSKRRRREGNESFGSFAELTGTEK